MTYYMHILLSIHIKEQALNLKSLISEMKNSWEEFISIFELAEERIKKFKERLIEIMQSEEQRE